MFHKQYRMKEEGIGCKLKGACEGDGRYCRKKDLGEHKEVLDQLQQDEILVKRVHRRKEIEQTTQNEQSQVWAC